MRAEIIQLICGCLGIAMQINGVTAQDQDMKLAGTIWLAASFVIWALKPASRKKA